MTRTESDLRHALLELERRADEVGAPTATNILLPAKVGRADAGPRRWGRWLPPLATAAAVAAAAVTVAALNGSSDRRGRAVQPGTSGGDTTTASASLRPTEPAVSKKVSAPARPAQPAGVLEDAATKLDAEPWAAPSPQQFFYVRTTDATTWTSVSGRQQGRGRTADGRTIWISGCRQGHLVSSGEAGYCTLKDVPHYLADAPKTARAWDAYLEKMVPGAKAAGVQGKFIVHVLHQDLVAPKAAAALLRFTATCDGLHLIPVEPVSGEKLLGVTCPSMTAGSYGLAFDAASHEFVGYVGVDQKARQVGPAEIVLRKGIVSAVGRKP
jgi:hypothetical protein